ncbi:MAG TPA: Arc family DNA-binding protein [Planctomycetota bacterium]|nr:Arc family DNA-binding protein [Planctomycetota bacterium]
MTKGGKSRDEPEEAPDRKAFLLRLPSELMEDLRAWAAQDLRSLNGHIEWLLREALKRRKSAKP